MALVGRADGVGALRHQVLEQHAHVEAGAAYGEVVGRPLTGLVLAPGLAQPFAVGLEAAAGHHAGARLNALRTGLAVDMRSNKAAGVKLEPLDFSLVTHLDTELLSAAVVSVHQCLAAAHEERIGARQMQRARQRRLKAHAVLAHPAAAARGLTDRQARHAFGGQAAGDLEQVLPEFFFGVGFGQHVLRRVMHATQVARVHRVAAAPLARRRLEHQHAGAGFARHQGRAQGSVAATDHQNIQHSPTPCKKINLRGFAPA